jgi:hypothetical protein
MEKMMTLFSLETNGLSYLERYPPPKMGKNSISHYLFFNKSFKNKNTFKQKSSKKHFVEFEKHTPLDPS